MSVIWLYISKEDTTEREEMLTKLLLLDELLCHGQLLVATFEGYIYSRGIVLGLGGVSVVFSPVT